ncbi:hypothetical protein Sjap_010306 [Stephania japonica]|uniref:Cytochrome P450 n=1 Tax=Stephania japonica TaxID=461633 RepID=A0AAP0P4H4_9MAGN
MLAIEFSLVHATSLVLLCLCFWRIGRWKSHDHDHSKGRAPRGSLGWPLIGETLQFVAANNSCKGFYDFVQTRRIRYGNCFKTNIFGKTHVFISGTKSARAVLSNDFCIFSKSYMRSIAELVGDESILCAFHHEQHQLLRNVLTSFFSVEAISVFIRHFDELTKKALHSWEKRGTVVVLEEALKITFNAMCKMLMSLEESNELEMLRKDVAQVFEAMLAFPINLPWTAFHKGLKARKKIENALANIINERRRVVEYSNEQDLLQFLLSGEKSTNGPLLPSFTDKQIQDNILTLIIAGQETTANAITWMMKYLDENQDVQETLRDEQLKIEEKSRASSLTADDLNKMSYASKVVKESLRMASIVPWFPRVALEDCKLEGFKIRKGWVINIDAKAIHLDSSVYQDPTRFHPPRSCQSPIASWRSEQGREHALE